MLLAVLGICVGTALASAGEGSFHPLGLLLMLTAEVSEAVRLVLTQKLLQNLKFGVVEGQFYMAPGRSPDVEPAADPSPHQRLAEPPLPPCPLLTQLVRPPSPQ